MNSKLILCLALVLSVGLLGCFTPARYHSAVQSPKVAANVKVKLRVVKVDSEETESQDGYGKNAVDGNPNTYWHTQWHGNSPGLPHEIIIELNPASVIKGFTYLPRQDESDHGTIKDYKFYVSDDGKNFGQSVKQGAFEPGKEEKIETFEPVKCRFIKLKAISEINGLPWTSAAEIRVIQSGEDASVMANKINQAANLLKEFERTKSIDQLQGTYMTLGTLPDLEVDKTVPKSVARQERAKLWFSLLAVMGENIDTNVYGPITLNLIPPPTPEGVRYFSGVDPKVIKDPETRSKYEAAIQENEKKKVRALFQTRLHNLDQIANIGVERFVRAYYTTSKEDQSELENLMKEAKLSPIRTLKLKALFESTNLAAKDAYIMHFGDTAPLHAALAKLSAQVPELSVAKLSDRGQYGQNSATADYIDTGGSKLKIIAKAYDTEAAAKAGQELDQGMIQAGGWNKREIIHGVPIFEFTGYGTMYFQIGLHTFNLTTIRGRTGSVQPLLQKVASALIADLAPP